MIDGLPGGKCFKRNGHPSTILSYTDSFLMYLLTIAYVRASVKKGPNRIIDQRGNLPTEFFPKIHGRLMASWDATVTTKATILVPTKGSITILMPNWHRLTYVTRKAVAAMPVTLDIPIAIFYSYNKITSPALLRPNLHQSFHQQAIFSRAVKFDFIKQKTCVPWSIRSIHSRNSNKASYVKARQQLVGMRKGWKNKLTFF